MNAPGLNAAFLIAIFLALIASTAHAQKSDTLFLSAGSKPVNSPHLKLNGVIHLNISVKVFEALKEISKRQKRSRKVDVKKLMFQFLGMVLIVTAISCAWQ